MFHWPTALSFLAHIPALMCLGGPTFIVLNFASHPLPLPSLSLDSPTSSSLAPFFFLPPASPVWHESFCLTHPVHVLSCCPPLLLGRHFQPLLWHLSQGISLGSANTMTL